MHEQIAPLSVHEMTLDLAGVVRNIEQKTQVVVREEVREDAANMVAEDLAVGERAIDPRPHRTEIALTDLRIDWSAGQFAVGKIDAGLLRRQDHFFQEFGTDLMAEAARTTVNGDDNFVLREPEGAGGRRVKNLGDRLDLEIVIAGAKRPHFPALAFLGAVYTHSGRAPAIRPCSSIRSKSRISPQPRATAHWAPCASMASISVASSAIALSLPTPAGIWRNSEFGELLLHWKDVGD